MCRKKTKKHKENTQRERQNEVCHTKVQNKVGTPESREIWYNVALNLFTMIKNQDVHPMPTASDSTLFQ